MFTIENINMVNSWGEMTLSQFIELEQILKADIPETYKSANIVSCLSGLSLEEVENLPLTTFTRLNNQTLFLLDEIPTTKHKDYYIINNTKYVLKADVTDITTSQYIDYQSYIKEGDLVKLLSLFLIPEGHKYNDGYNMSKVQYDIENMVLLDAQSIAFFLRIQLAASILIMKDCLKEQMKKEKKPKQEIRQVETLYNNMASCLLL